MFAATSRDWPECFRRSRKCHSRSTASASDCRSPTEAVAPCASPRHPCTLIHTVTHASTSILPFVVAALFSDCCAELSAERWAACQLWSPTIQFSYSNRIEGRRKLSCSGCLTRCCSPARPFDCGSRTSDHRSRPRLTISLIA